MTDGTPVPAIARLVAAHPDAVRDVIHAFNAQGLSAPEPHWAGGRPRRITDQDLAFVVATARQRPTKLHLPFTHWSIRKLAAYLNGRYGRNDATTAPATSTAATTWPATSSGCPARTQGRHVHRVSGPHPGQEPLALTRGVSHHPDQEGNTTPAIKKWAAAHKVELCLTPANASWANPIEAQFGPLRY